MVFPRQYQPPESETPNPSTAISFLNEPLFLNSSIRLQKPNSSLLIPAENFPIHQTGLTSVRDLMRSPSYDIIPHQLVMTPGSTSYDAAVELDSPRYMQFRSIVSDIAENWRFLLPRVNRNSIQNTNSLWAKILPKEPLVFLRSAVLPLHDHVGPGDIPLFPPRIKWTNDPSKVSFYPIQVPIPPETCDPKDEGSLVPILSMTTKQYAVAFNRVSYTKLKVKSDIKKSFSHVPSPFRPGQGWMKQLLVTKLDTPWQTIVDALAADSISEFSHYYCITMMYPALWCPVVHKRAPNTPSFILPDGSFSNWICCPRCSKEYTPVHAAYECSGLASFWATVHRVLMPLLPHESVVPRANIEITAMEIPCCGLSLLADPSKFSPERNMVINVFACAFKAILTTLRHKEFDQPLTAQHSQTQFQKFAISQFTLNWCDYLRSRCSHLSVRLKRSKIAAQPFPKLVVISPTLDILYTEIESGRSLPSNPAEILQRQSELVYHHFPYLYLDPEPPDPTNQYRDSDTDPNSLPPSQIHTCSNLRIVPPSDTWPPVTFVRDLPHYARPSTATPVTPTTTGITVEDPINRAPQHPPFPFPMDILSAGTARDVTNKLVVPFFTDGSCRNNGRRSAKAGFALLCPTYPALNHSNRLPPTFTQSNNPAEIMAVTESLKRALDLQATVHPTVVIPEICTDSQYIIQSVISHIPLWKASKPPDMSEPNASLIAELGTLSRQQTIIWRYVRAHTTATDYFSHFNREVDSVANKTTIG